MNGDPSPAAVIDRARSAYNRRDLDAFLACFDEAAELSDLRGAAVTMRGREEIGRRYGDLFSRCPDLHAHGLHRSVVDGVVSDHDLVTGRIGGDVEFLLTYEVVDGLIRRAWSVRGPHLPALTVRVATPDDRAAVLDIGRLSYVERGVERGPEALPDKEFGPEELAAALADPGTTYLLGSTGDGVVGLAKVRWDQPLPTGSGVGAELQYVHVRPSAQADGVEVRLLAAAQRMAEGRGQTLSPLAHR